MDYGENKPGLDYLDFIIAEFVDYKWDGAFSLAPNSKGLRQNVMPDYAKRNTDTSRSGGDI